MWIRPGLLLALCLVTAVNSTQAQTPQPLQRIAFGSCVRQDRGQPIWQAVRDYQPQTFLMIGDNIYGDSEDMEILRFKYNQLASNPGFAALRQETRLLAVWDDHDYGVNDGGAEYPAKHESQKLFCDFFAVPADSPRRHRDGIYDSQVVGPPGKQVQFILLDTRFFRTPLNRVRKSGQGLGPFGPTQDPDATILGQAQWEWLEEQLKVPAEVRIIASSIQFVAIEHGWETWGNFPSERQRLLDLLAKYKTSGVLLISGDRHLAEISKIPADQSPTNYPIYDITSSSLNQPSGGGNEGEPNRFRVSDHYPQVNFGTIDIDWSANTTLKLAIRDIEGKAVRTVKLNLSDLN